MNKTTRSRRRRVSALVLPLGRGERLMIDGAEIKHWCRSRVAEAPADCGHATLLGCPNQMQAVTRQFTAP